MGDAQNESGIVCVVCVSVDASVCWIFLFYLHPKGMWDPSSDQGSNPQPCWKAGICHWTTRKVPIDVSLPGQFEVNGTSFALPQIPNLRETEPI